ncbi:MAG TPA: hypothetical protein VEX68_11385, partial [Bryobacteraceae bacterium]|nr:hypothetical protein [Bryobacteraceae bacterium]
STTYKGANPGFHVLALSRQPNSNKLDAPDLVWDKTYTNGADTFNALVSIRNTDPDALLIVNGVGNYGFGLADKVGNINGVPVGVGWYLGTFGAYSDLAGISGAIPFTFIGVGGANAQTALQRGYGTRDVQGYLAPDSNVNYAFIQTDFVRYDIKLNGDITVGQNTYTVADSYRCNRNIPGCALDCNGQNAFHAVIVDREDPNTVYMNSSYCTTGSDNEILRIMGDINTVTANLTNESRLVLIGSNGKPIPANRNFGLNGDPRIYPLAQMIAKLGGYWETMVYLSPNDTYSLVGAPAPPPGTKGARNRARESSSVYPEIRQNVRPSGELHGVLARGRGNWYSPLNADPSGNANLGFYEALATASAPFPTPNATAFQYISQKLCGSGCNIRNLYATQSVAFTNYQIQLQALPDSAGRSCDTAGSNADANFCAVRAQLLTEFVYVTDVYAFYTNLQSVWQGTGTVNILALLSAYNDINGQLNPPQAAPSQSLTSPLVNFFLALGSFIPEVGPLFGLADVAFNFGTSLTTDPQGNKSIDLTSTIANLQTQAMSQFTNQATTTGTFFDLVYQDWGKLSKLGQALSSQQDQKSPWYWGPTYTGRMLNAMTTGIRQAAYQNIMSAAYAIGSYVPNSAYSNGWGWGLYPLDAQPYAYRVIVNRQSAQTPLSSPFFTPNYVPYTYPGDPAWSPAPVPTSTLLSDGAWLGISAINTPWNGTSDSFQYTPPSEDIRSLLFRPIWDHDGLGVYRPAFFNSWPFPRVQCNPSYGNQSNGGTWVGGCNWSAAAPAPEHLEPRRLPLTSVTVRTVQTSREQPRQPQVDVILTVHNNGTTTAQSVTINSLQLRTLNGVGQATVVNPALPITLSNLRPGDTASVPVRLNVPTGVMRLSLTQEGTINSGSTAAPAVFRFSEAQALFLQ